MIIWSNNFAEKLFGFAMSREQLRETALCSLLDDPNLQLDIDLAIDFNQSVRGDEVAAERFTNKLVLSSSFLDQSSLDFYTTRMDTYPIFEYHISRIQLIFDTLEQLPSGADTTPGTAVTSSNPNITTEDNVAAIIKDKLKIPAEAPTDDAVTNTFTDTILEYDTYKTAEYSLSSFYNPTVSYNNITYSNLGIIQAYNTSSTGNSEEDGFLDKLLDALKDCLNSPCNLFAESSESIASMIDLGAAGNNSTIPTFAELKGKFKNVFGGMKTTLTKRMPDAVSNMFSELAVVGKEAWSQSVDMLYEKDPEKKQKIIDKALGGDAIDSDSTSYSYIPDLDALTSVSDMASTILSQVASDLGGCYDKYQQSARYSPYDPDQNTSRTNKDPVVDSVDGQATVRTSSGIGPIDYKRGVDDLNVCPTNSNSKVSAPRASAGSASSGGTSNPLKYSDQYEKVMQYLKGSKFDPAANGGKYIIPKDGAVYGITTGSIEEWADFFTRMADVESTFGRDDGRGTGSMGMYQLGTTAWSIHGDGGDIFNNDDNTRTFVKYAENLYFGGGGTGFDKYGGQERIGVIDPSVPKGYSGIAAGFGPLQNITYDEAYGTSKASLNENRKLRR